jgi:uncharacterized DUF497 family protein
MIDEEFEWDDDKATSNFEKHGIGFEDARAVFRDPFAVELFDDREDRGEERYILIGMSVSGILVVIYTERNERNRIISARNAEPNEQRYYHESNR